MKEIIGIYGGGGHGAVVADIAMLLGYAKVIFIDDFGKDGIVFKEFCEKYSVLVAMGIGNNLVRERIYNSVLDKGLQVATLIHPRAVISPSATIGEGTVVMANCVVNARAVIGRGCIINTACIIEHDNVIGDFAHVSPGASLAGNVRLGQYSHIGVNGTVIPQTTIGDHTVIGAGAVVTKDIPDGVIAYGNPARVIKKNIV